MSWTRKQQDNHRRANKELNKKKRVFRKILKKVKEQQLKKEERV